MRTLTTNIFFSAALAAACAAGVQAHGQQQQVSESQAATAAAGRPAESRVPLTEVATAYDAAGRAALSARLRTTQLAGSPDSPARNSRLVVENRGASFYTHASGWATFYDAEGVRCGEGLWKVEALAPGESAEVDTPGLRLTCAPSTWRVVAINLLTRAGDFAAPTAAPPAQASVAAPAGSVDGQAPPASAAVPPLEININGKTIPVQLGNPLEVTVGRERVRIVVSPAP